MYPHILDQNQRNALPILNHFSDDYYLAGGTAIALQIGHRKSIDFDLFTPGAVRSDYITTYFAQNNLDFAIIFEDTTQLHGICQGVKITFFQYPFNIAATQDFQSVIQLPDLLTLGAMKAYTLGRRAKWKDYVDVYFLLQNHHSLKELSARAEEIFGSLFNEKLLRQQLVYFDDIDYTEAVEYIEQEVAPADIQEYLAAIATELLVS